MPSRLRGTAGARLDVAAVRARIQHGRDPNGVRHRTHRAQAAAAARRGVRPSRADRGPHASRSRRRTSSSASTTACSGSPIGSRATARSCAVPTTGRSAASPGVATSCRAAAASSSPSTPSSCPDPASAPLAWPSGGDAARTRATVGLALDRRRMPRAGLRPATPVRDACGDRMAGWTVTRTTSPIRSAFRSPCRPHPAEPPRAGFPLARHASRRSRVRSGSGGHRIDALARVRGARAARRDRLAVRRPPAGAPARRRAAAERAASRRAPGRGRRAPRPRARLRRGVGSRRRGASSSDALPRLARRRPGPSCSVAAPCASTLRIDGTPADDADREVLDAAARLDDAPVRRPAAGIGFVGAPPLARVVRTRPDRAGREPVPSRSVEIEVPPGERWAWAATLPHRRGEPRSWSSIGRQRGRWRTRRALRDARRSPSPTRSTACRPGSRPSSRWRRPAAHVERRSGAPPSHDRARAAHRDRSRRVGVGRDAAANREGSDAAALPDRVALGSLAQPATPAGSRTTLRVAVGVTPGRSSSTSWRADRTRSSPAPPAAARASSCSHGSRRWREATRPTGSRSSWSTSRAARRSSRSAASACRRHRDRPR